MQDRKTTRTERRAIVKRKGKTKIDNLKVVDTTTGKTIATVEPKSGKPDDKTPPPRVMKKYDKWLSKAVRCGATNCSGRCRE